MIFLPSIVAKLFSSVRYKLPAKFSVMFYIDGLKFCNILHLSKKLLIRALSSQKEDNVLPFIPVVQKWASPLLFFFTSSSYSHTYHISRLIIAGGCFELNFSECLYPFSNKNFKPIRPSVRKIWCTGNLENVKVEAIPVGVIREGVKG